MIQLRWLKRDNNELILQYREPKPGKLIIENGEPVGLELPPVEWIDVPIIDGKTGKEVTPSP